MVSQLEANGELQKQASGWHWRKDMQIVFLVIVILIFIVFDRLM